MAPALEGQFPEGSRTFAVSRWGDGDGPSPVVLVHASGLGPVQWLLLGPRLAADRRVHALHLLGYAGSSAMPEGYSVQDDLAGLVALIDRLPRPPHVVGHSFGGFLALGAAMDTTVASLCLLEPVCFGLLRALDDPVVARSSRGGATMDAFVSAEQRGDVPWLRSFIDYWNGPGAWDALPGHRQKAYAHVGPKVLAEVRAIWRDDRGPEAYGSVGVPTTLAVSEHTTAEARRVVDVLRDLLPSTRTDHVPGHGHLFPIQDHAGTLRLVREHVTWAEAEAS